MIVDVTVRCEVAAKTRADEAYALRCIGEPGRPMLDGGSYGRDGSYSISPLGVVRVRRVAVERHSSGARGRKRLGGSAR